MARKVHLAAIVALWLLSPTEVPAASRVYMTPGRGPVPLFTDRPLDAGSRLVMIHAWRDDPAYRPPAAGPVAGNLGAPWRGKPGGRVPHRAGRAPVGVAALIEAAALRHGMEPALLLAVAAEESGFEPASVSPAGAVGVMQLMPDTAQRYGITDRYDAWQNIDAGTRYLRDLLVRFDGDLSLALAGYNAGEHAVIRHGLRIPPYPETRRYVPSVLERYRAYRRQTSGSR